MIFSPFEVTWLQLIPTNAAFTHGKLLSGLPSVSEVRKLSLFILKMPGKSCGERAERLSGGGGAATAGGDQNPGSCSRKESFHP